MHAANHSAQRLPDAFGYSDLLWRVGGSKFLSDTCSSAVTLELVACKLASLVGASFDDALPERYHG